MELFRARQAEGKSVCVGLDADYDKIPKSIHDKHSNSYFNTVIDFDCSIVDMTKKVACAYKINTAFFESHGEKGWRALQATIVHINKIIAEKVPVILDAKRADIGNTNAGYAKMAFDYLKADAITVNPYFGAEAMQPFLDRTDKGIFVLCHTSNPGASEFQDLMINNPEYPDWGGRNIPLYQYVARRVMKEWNKNGNCGLVVGATYPDQLHEVRKIIGDIPILIPGIGAQGGDIEATVTAGADSNGMGMLINSSRGIIFKEAPDVEALNFHNLINKYLKEGQP